MNSTEPPLVSIVTPSYNMANYLPEAIESVLGQDYPHIEYIVVDGGSTDGTPTVLERYRDRLAYTSAADTGPSHAIFQGFRRAKGDILAWLSADDTLLPGAVRTVVEFFTSRPEVDIVYGEGWWIDEKGAIISRYPSLAFDVKTLESDCFICQPAAFVRASAYRRYELDPQVNCSFDYDLWIRMAKAGLRFVLIPEYLANSRVHIGAKTIRERDKVFRDTMALLKKHYGYIPLSWIFGYTAFRLDHRDQFFAPLQPSVWKYLASLPMGIWHNRRAPQRFVAEWAAKPFTVAMRRIRRGSAQQL